MAVATARVKVEVNFDKDYKEDIAATQLDCTLSEGLVAGRVAADNSYATYPTEVAGVAETDYLHHFLVCSCGFTLWIYCT